MITTTVATQPRRTQPERLMKVITVDVKGSKFQYEIEAKHSITGKIVNLRDILDSGDGTIPSWYPKVWKSIGRVQTSILKNQKGKFSVEIRNDITKRVIVNHSLSNGIKLQVHPNDPQHTLMWIVPQDIGGSNDDEGNGNNNHHESTVCLKFNSITDVNKFKYTWLDCQSKM